MVLAPPPKRLEPPALLFWPKAVDPKPALVSILPTSSSFRRDARSLTSARVGSRVVAGPKATKAGALVLAETAKRHDADSKTRDLETSRMEQCLLW